MEQIARVKQTTDGRFPPPGRDTEAGASGRSAATSLTCCIELEGGESQTPDLDRAGHRTHAMEREHEANVIGSGIGQPGQKRIDEGDHHELAGRLRAILHQVFRSTATPFSSRGRRHTTNNRLTSPNAPIAPRRRASGSL